MSRITVESRSHDWQLTRLEVVHTMHDRKARLGELADAFLVLPGGFVRPAHRILAQRALTVDDALALALGPVPDTPHKWLASDKALLTP